MQKNSLLLLLAVCLQVAVAGQRNRPSPLGVQRNGLGLGISIPIGAFNMSHTPGIALDYYRCPAGLSMDSTRFRSINFLLHATLNFNAGRSKPEGGYTFQYGSYWLLAAMAGVDYRPALPVSIALTAGPVVSLYSRVADAGVAVAGDWRYRLSRRIAIGPGVHYWKFSRTKALWVAAFKGVYAF